MDQADLDFGIYRFMNAVLAQHSPTLGALRRSEERRYPIRDSIKLSPEWVHCHPAPSHCHPELPFIVILSDSDRVAFPRGKDLGQHTFIMLSLFSSDREAFPRGKHLDQHSLIAHCHAEPPLIVILPPLIVILNEVIAKHSLGGCEFIQSLNRMETLFTGRR